MAYASRSGRARTSASSPQAFGVCDRCGIWYNRVDLQNQYRWRGAALLPTWVFVCPRCLDIPNEQERAIVLPADPVPIPLPRPEDFSVENTLMGLAASGAVDPITNIPVSPTTAMQTVDGILMGPTPVGRPNGYDALTRTPVTGSDAVVFMAQVNGTEMAQVDGTNMATEQQGGRIPVDFDNEPVPPLPTDEQGYTYGAPLPVVSLLADGTPLVRATCNAPHGLALNSQIMVRGSLQPLADGVFSVIPITATAFTYGTYSPVPAGSILGPETLIVTAIVGLPTDHPALPQTGPAYSQHRPTKTSQ